MDYQTSLLVIQDPAGFNKQLDALKMRLLNINKKGGEKEELHWQASASTTTTDLTNCPFCRK